MADISKIKLPSDTTVYNLKDASAIHSISGTSPISVNGTTISHANSGVTAASKGDTTNQTPTWGGTFKALSGTVNATGHLTSFAEHTVTIPNTVATSSTAGLMSATDKASLDNLSTQLAALITRVTDLENNVLLCSGAVTEEAVPSGEGVNF